MGLGIHDIWWVLVTGRVAGGGGGVEECPPYYLGPWWWVVWSFLSLTEKMVKVNSLFGVGRSCKTVCERFWDHQEWLFLRQRLWGLSTLQWGHFPFLSCSPGSAVPGSPFFISRVGPTAGFEQDRFGFWRWCMASKCAAWLVNYPPDYWTMRHFKLQPPGFVVPLHSEFAVGNDFAWTDWVSTMCRSYDAHWSWGVSLSKEKKGGN